MGRFEILKNKIKPKECTSRSRQLSVLVENKDRYDLCIITPTGFTIYIPARAVQGPSRGEANGAIHLQISPEAAHRIMEDLGKYK